MSPFDVVLCSHLSGVLWKHGSLLYGAEFAPAAHRCAVREDSAAGMAHAHRHTTGASLMHEQMHLTSLGLQVQTQLY